MCRTDFRAAASLLVFLWWHTCLRLLHNKSLRRGDVRGLSVLQEHGQHGEPHFSGGTTMAGLRETLKSGVK